MPFGARKKDGRRSKQTKRTGVRSRAEAAAETASSDDEYIAAYRAFFTSLLPEARLALQRRIVERVEMCGNSGLVDNEDDYVRLINQGLMPYTDPVTLNDGIVPSDTIELHGQCISRRGVITYLETQAEQAGHVPRLFDGMPLTRADMLTLNLDANDYRFFNSRRAPTRAREPVAYQPPAHDINMNNNDEVQNLHGDDAEMAYHRMRTALNTERAAEEVEKVDEEIENLIDPDVTLQEMITILRSTVALQMSLDDEYVVNLLPELNLHGVPNMEEFADPWDDFEEFISLNLNVGQQQAVLEMVTSYYLQENHLLTSERHARMMAKLRYLLFDYSIIMIAGDDEEFTVKYEYYPFEICQTIQYALNWDDVGVLRLLVQWVDEVHPEFNTQHGHRIPCALAAVSRAYEEYRERYTERKRGQPLYVNADAQPILVNSLIQRIIAYEATRPPRAPEE